MRSLTLSLLVAGTLLSSLGASVTSCRTHRVERISPNQQTDLSGRWNDTDAKLVSEEMIKDALGRPWLQRFKDAHQGKAPVIIVGPVRNNTAEHIDADAFVREMEKVFVQQGSVRVVQNGDFREAMRTERADQGKYASEESKKKWARELGADYMLTGNMLSITDQYKRDKAIFYKINLELSDLETNEKVWIGDKEIKKLIAN